MQMHRMGCEEAMVKIAKRNIYVKTNAAYQVNVVP